jgi:hypothetical protein
MSTAGKHEAAISQRGGSKQNWASLPFEFACQHHNDNYLFDNPTFISKEPPPPMMPIRSRHYSRGSHQALLFLYIAQSVTFCCLVFSIMLKKIWVLQREHTELNILLKHSCMYFRFEFLTCIQFWDSMIFEVSATALLFRALAKHSISLAITMVEVLSAMWF